jgi:hypothetical protein
VGHFAESDDVFITKRFLVRTGIAHVVLALDDISWVYVKQTKYSVNFIPVGTSRSLEMYSYGPAHRWVTVGVDVDIALFALLTKEATRARFGYTPENEAWWKRTRLEQAKRQRAQTAS